MEIIDTTTTARATTGAAENSQNGVISSDFETFLKMLTVQMQNQDPLDPIKSEDYAVQLATFSGVEQQVRTNDLLAALATQMNVNGMTQIAGWVGMEARAPVAAGFDGSDPITVSPNPERLADAAILVVKDAAGDEVQRISIPVAGDQFLWDGVLDDGSTADDGAYVFEVESYVAGELSSTRIADVYVPIVEARNQGGQTVLVTDIGEQIAAVEITAIRDPSLL